MKRGGRIFTENAKILSLSLFLGSSPFWAEVATRPNLGPIWPLGYILEEMKFEEVDDDNEDDYEDDADNDDGEAI